MSDPYIDNLTGREKMTTLPRREYDTLTRRLATAEQERDEARALVRAYLAVEEPYRHRLPASTNEAYDRLKAFAITHTPEGSGT